MSHRLAPKGPLGSAKECPGLFESPSRVRGPGLPAEELVSKTTGPCEAGVGVGRGRLLEAPRFVSQLILTIATFKSQLSLGPAHHQQIRPIPPSAHTAAV